MNTRISFYTLGCRLNQAETAILRRSFEENGYEVVNFENPADVVVVNTCTVTENGDADTRKLVNRIHRRNPQARIALLGCQAQIQRERLLDLPNVQWVIGNARKMEAAVILRERQHPGQPRVVTPAISRRSFTIPTAGIDHQHTRANLKIQDGCDFFCAFCVIPYARGRARSREFTDIIREAGQLVASGHRELVLTGINIGTYQYREKTLADVTARLAQIPALDRIRISSVEPTTLVPQIMKQMKEGSRLCRYLHIPLQSGSDDILKTMNRKYTAEEFSRIIRQICRDIPGICLGTDVMVGFPGETDQHFQQTRELLVSLPLTYFHVFSYSQRPWTRSSRMTRPVPPAVIEHRSRTLRELGADKRQDYMQNHLGMVEAVLFEQRRGDSWTGLTDTYIRVQVRSDKNFHNQILPVRLESIDKNQMTGTIV